MDFVIEVGKRFTYSAAAAMGVLMAVGFWFNGLSGAINKISNKIFVNPDNSTKDDKNKKTSI